MQKRISELTPEEQEARRVYNREAKKRSREKQKTVEIPTAEEWTWDWASRHPEQYRELNEYTKKCASAVSEELGRTLGPESEIVDRVAWTLLGFKKNLVQRVSDPKGEIIGGLFFADVIGSEIVTAAHRYGLLKSATFAELFGELLQILDKRYRHEETKHSRAVKHELDEWMLGTPAVAKFGDQENECAHYEKQVVDKSVVSSEAEV
jgi:hypothetical protein